MNYGLRKFHTSDMETFGERLKDLREQRGWAQDAFGKMLGVAGATISRWENNVNQPEFDFLRQIVDIFGTTLDYLVLGRE